MPYLSISRALASINSGEAGDEGGGFWGGSKRKGHQGGDCRSMGELERSRLAVLMLNCFLAHTEKRQVK